MINNCKFFFLGCCLKDDDNKFSASCIHINDPQSCPFYEEEIIKPYHTPSSREVADKDK